MLKDITIGQYFPGKSPLHRMDARVKILLTMAYIVMLFIAKNAYGIAVGVVFIMLAYLISGIPFRMILKSIRPVVMVICFTAVLNMFFVQGETVLFTFWRITITAEGLWMAFVLSVRIISLIIGTSLLTYTTSPIALTDAIERLLGPFKLIGAPVHELAMMMTIALRFIPTLIEETDKIMSAQKARGADMESGGIIQRAKAMIPILIPLFVSSFRRAEELALAMESRCYHGGEGRTRMKQLKVSGVDYVGVLYMAAFFGLVIFFNIRIPTMFR